MRYALGVLFLASCTMLTPLPGGHLHVEQPVPVTQPARQASRQEVQKLKPASSLPPSPTPEISTCVNLDAGDLKETIKAKLDCIAENAR